MLLAPPGRAGRSSEKAPVVVRKPGANSDRLFPADHPRRIVGLVSRDLIGVLRGQGFIAPGPRSPTPGAPYTYVTTKAFLSHFSFDTLRDLPDFEALEDAGLLSKEKLLAGDIPAGLASGAD
jgi:hypothetical protein